MIRPVKLVLRASIAASAVSLSPKIMNTRGSIAYLARNFFLLNAGICSGTTNSIFSFLILSANVDKFLRVGPLSTIPLLIS